jgi:hypothetical protein
MMNGSLSRECEWKSESISIALRLTPPRYGIQNLLAFQGIIRGKAKSRVPGHDDSYHVYQTLEWWSKTW